uniref:Uncharacterized protein n=1 Tax=Heterorhabditis bacteriophora TaxID=37862 RepID=A0A1I7XBM5_HETBA
MEQSCIKMDPRAYKDLKLERRQSFRKTLHEYLLASISTKEIWTSLLKAAKEETLILIYTMQSVKSIMIESETNEINNTNNASG